MGVDEVQGYCSGSPCRARNWSSASASASASRANCTPPEPERPPKPEARGRRNWVQVARRTLPRHWLHRPPSDGSACRATVSAVGQTRPMQSAGLSHGPRAPTIAIVPAAARSYQFSLFVQARRLQILGARPGTTDVGCFRSPSVSSHRLPLHKRRHDAKFARAARGAECSAVPAANRLPMAHVAQGVLAADHCLGYFRQFWQERIWSTIQTTLIVTARERTGREAQPTAGIIDSQSVKRPRPAPCGV